MAGLLDDFSSFIKTPEGQGLLSGVFGYAANAKRGQPINSLGRGGIAGLMGYAEAQDRAEKQEENAFQQKYRTMQMGDMQRKIDQQAAQQKWLETLNPSQGRLGAALGGGGDPTTNNAATLGAPVDPSQQMMWEAARSGVVPASDYIKSFLPDTEAYTLGEGQVRIKGGKIVAQAPAESKAPSKVQEYEYAVKNGYKGSFADHRVSVDVAAYYIDWTDIQLSVLDPDTQETYYTNGGKSSSKGVELAMQWRATNNLQLGVNAAYAIAQLEQDLPDGTIGAAGDRLPFSPRFSGSFNADYNFPVGSLYGFVGASLTHRMEQLAGANTEVDARHTEISH